MNSNRAVIIDRWNTKDGKRTARHGIGMRWRARFVDDAGREQTKAFGRKVDARAWLDDVITRFRDQRCRARGPIIPEIGVVARYDTDVC